MNLIEEYGSYEDARYGLRVLESSAYEEDQAYANKLKNKMLEYRRQHNIYEEGDKIVFIDDFMHDELMTVAWTRKGEVWMDEGAKRCTDLSMIRHADDAEIKAGKRRPELDSDTCSDIRNHVSPLTKVIDR